MIAILVNCFCCLSILAGALQDESNESLLKNASDALRAGREEQALDWCRIILETNPGEVRAIHMTGYILYRAGDLHDAEDYFLRAMKIDGGDSYSIQMLGNICLELFRPFEAKAYYQKALEVNPDDEVLKMNLALAEERITRAGQLSKRFERSRLFFWCGVVIGCSVLLLIVALELKRRFLS